MEEAIKKVTPEIIESQKDLVVKEIATAKLHLDFHTKQFDAKKPNNKEEKETIAHQKLQTINPIMDNIDIKTKYYEFLCEKES